MMRLALFLILSAAGFYPLSVSYASSSLSPREFITAGIGPVLQLKLNKWLEKNPRDKAQGYYQAAEINMNDDKIPELLVVFSKPDGNCPPKSGCLFLILADTGRSLTEIGAFEAYSVRLGPQTESGHRTIGACGDLWNDYNCPDFVYDPAAGRYVKSAE
jgi:hypothetical protein